MQIVEFNKYGDIDGTNLYIKGDKLIGDSPDISGQYIKAEDVKDKLSDIRIQMLSLLPYAQDAITDNEEDWEIKQYAISTAKNELLKIEQFLESIKDKE